MNVMDGGGLECSRYSFYVLSELCCIPWKSKQARLLHREICRVGEELGETETFQTSGEFLQDFKHQMSWQKLLQNITSLLQYYGQVQLNLGARSLTQ